MAWIEYHEGLRDHWKIHRLSKELNIPYAHALGCVSSLWLWLIPNARNGNVQKFENYEICRAMMLENCEIDVKKVLKKCHLLDESEKIHDWKKHGVSYLDSNRKRVQKLRKQKRDCNVTETELKRTTNLTNQPNQPIVKNSKNFDGMTRQQKNNFQQLKEL